MELSAQIEEIDRVLGTWPTQDTVFRDALRARRERLEAELAANQQQLRAIMTMDVAGVPPASALPAARDVGPEPAGAPLAPARPYGAPVAPPIAPTEHIARPASGGWMIGAILAVSITALVLSCVALFLVWSILAGFITPRSGTPLPPAPSAAAAPGLGGPPTSTPSPAAGMTQVTPTTTPTVTPGGAAAAETAAAGEGPGDISSESEGTAGAHKGASEPSACAPVAESRLATGRIQPPRGYQAASLHTYPSTAAPMLTMVPRSTTVQLLGQWASGGGYTWVRVRTSGGQVGWMIATAVRPE